MRIEKHPILGDLKKIKEITLVVDGKKIKAYEGEMISAALIASDKLLYFSLYLQEERAKRNILCNWQMYRLCYGGKRKAERENMRHTGGG